MRPPKALDIKNALKKVGNPKKADFLAGFFKTGKGQYGEGDIFLGVTVPQSRVIAKKFKNLPMAEISQLLSSKIHEDRLVALLIMTDQFMKSDDETIKEKIYQLFLKKKKYINNWDLVDTSAPIIMGAYLFDHKKKVEILPRLAKSKNLWDRRIAMMSTFYFIKKGSYAEPLKIATLLLHDEHDLIHKAVGWLLREIGNRDILTEESFLNKHAASMPRTMLRYAIEKFPQEKKNKYMKMGKSKKP